VKHLCLARSYTTKINVDAAHNYGYEQRAMFTAAQIAAALYRPKRSVLEALERTACSGTKIVHGNAARAWAKDALPQNILGALENEASRRKMSVELLLASPAPLWRPRFPLSQLTDAAIERASLLQQALAPALERRSDDCLTKPEFERLSIEDYRRIFGYSISARHWRRLFRRTLVRDGGAKNWARLEIYLDESPARKPELSRPIHFVSAAFRPLEDLIASFANPAAATELEKSCLWIYAFEHFEQETERTGKPKAVKRDLLNFLYENAPFLGNSPKGIKIQFDRKLNRWIAGGRIPAGIADARRKNPGRPAPGFSEKEEHLLAAKALRCGGGLAQAWRESRENGLFSSAISQHYTATPASKSYVPTRIRKLLANKIKMLRDHHHGPRTAKLNGAYINRDPSTFNAGDWFQADDVTLPNYYYIVYADSSGVRRFDYLVQAVKRAGPRKILFGSDGPWLHPGVELYKIRMLGLPREAEALILGGNAKRLIFGSRFGRKLHSVTRRARINGAFPAG
jgi:hypothetical protein